MYCGLTLIGILISGILTGQNKLDSLQKALADTPGESVVRLHILLQISKEYTESKPDTAIILVNEVLNQISDRQDSLNIHANILLSTAYSFKAAYDQSISYSMKAMKLAELAQDTAAMLDAYNNLGIDFMFSEDYETSYSWFSKFRDLAEKARDSLRLGHAYNNLGMIEYYRGNKDNELSFYLSAREVFEQINEKEGLANAHLNVGTVKTDNGQYDAAQPYYEEALKLFNELGYISGQVSVFQSISENHLKAGRYNQSLEFAEKSLDLITGSEFKYDLTFSYDLMEQSYRAKGNYKQAHEYLKKYHELNQEIFTEEKSKQINELNIRYETEKKQQAIELLTAKNEINELQLSRERRNKVLMMVGFLVLIGIGTYGYISNRRRYQLKNQLLASEINELRAQIRNALNGQQKSITLDEGKLEEIAISPLSSRELEILNFAMSNYTNQEIAEKAFVSVNTVKFHLKNIYLKLGVGNTREALQEALQAGNVPDNS